MPKQPPTVDQFMQQLEHPLKAEIEAVRAIVLGADPQITEHIKWNAPSFCYGGDDRVTLRLHPPSRLQLIFHRGAKVKDSEGFRFEDGSGLLKWVAADRAVFALGDMADIQARRDALADLVQRWVLATGPSATP
jgi:hypothetical protein